MSRNIKEIGKELLGKSLNSYHRKTGLTQLEENNKMQDGILDGILSQVDDAYIEKTEQSNVIHLDGSGDGVVVLDGIEGNTMVNLANIRKTYINHGVIANDIITLTQKDIDQNYALSKKDLPHKIGEKYTVVINVIKNTCSRENSVASASSSGLGVGDYALNFSSTSIQQGFTGVRKILGTTREVNSNVFFHLCLIKNTTSPSGEFAFQIMVLEGDWTNREIPASYFEGLQSSFEEKVNDEVKYEIEILSNNRNLVKNTDFKANSNGIVTHKASGEINVKSTVNTGGVTYKTDRFKVGKEITFKSRIRVNSTVNGTSCTLRIFNDTTKTWIHAGNNGVTSDCSLNTIGEKTLKLKVNLTESNYKNGDVLLFYVSLGMNTTNDHSIDFDILKDGVSIELGNTINSEILPHKQNKIKLLLDEPLRRVRDVKDELCVKNGKLVVKRNIIQKYYNGTQGEFKKGWTNVEDLLAVDLLDLQNKTTKDFSQNIICDRFATSGNSNTEGCYKYYSDTPLLSIPVVVINKNKLVTPDIEGFKVWLRNNPINVVCVLEEPIYEEVLNEYGEPILLEGYENGTIYIDSTIVPTTTVRYTPKMQSFKTLKEVNDNNIMLTNDINDNIIPYLMDVDLMIMEKEMALPNQINIGKMEELDMTSMQKRTQDMLERLIKGKTLTEQECKTRVTTYLNAGKITDAQAEELNFLIDEIYA